MLRVLADRMKRGLNQLVIVENVTGAAGTISPPCRSAHSLKLDGSDGS